MFTVLRKPFAIEDVNWALDGVEVQGEGKILDFQSARRERSSKDHKS